MRTRVTLVATLVAFALLPGSPASGERAATLSWDAAAGVVDVALPAGDRTELTVAVTGGTVTGLPEACTPSSVVRKRAYLDEADTTLTCPVRAGDATTVAVPLTAPAGAGDVTVSVTQPGGSPQSLAVSGAPSAPATPTTLRLLSSPDFLNADVGDLRDGPGDWRPGRSANSDNRAYERALDTVMDDWSAQDPDAVLVAGDTVDGRWGRDEQHTGNFGPVRTQAQRVAAVRRAAATYYPQWVQRFRDHHLEVYPAVGDHEYGDNPWPRSKRALAPAFKAAFARWMVPGHLDHPRGPHAGTAYAWRPSPDVQVVGIDLFDITRGHARLHLDDRQRHWLVSVLRKAQRDGVQWTIVQGHIPVLWPVRTRGSSGLHYPGGAHSRLWRIFERYGVDLYLCGEVHDTTASDAGGVLQLAHGGMFQYGLTTYARLDVHPDRIDVSLNDFDMSVKDAPDRSRLWETVRGGMKKRISVAPAAYTIGTLTLAADDSITERSGILDPYTPRHHS